jgi:hypothetical protein
MSEMVERVAKAITEAFSESGIFDDAGCSSDGFLKHDAPIIARAAIAAMREPTKEMKASG